MNTKHDQEWDIVFRFLGIKIVRIHCHQLHWQDGTPPEPKRSASQPMDDTPRDMLVAPEEDVCEPLFVVNSLFLRDCFDLLTQTDEENLHAVTGSVIRKIRTLDRIVPLRLSMQSMGGAAAADESLANELIHLHEFGLLPLAYFHSHPGRGAAGTLPSDTDRRTQAAMEQMGSRIVAGVFSRDGHVRFFANEWEPRIRVTGKRVRKVEDNVYQLEIN